MSFGYKPFQFQDKKRTLTFIWITNFLMRSYLFCIKEIKCELALVIKKNHF